jgi:hypothetical protein
MTSCVYNFFHTTSYAHNLCTKKIWKKREKEKKRKNVSAHVGALDGAARAVAWSDRALK